MTAATISEFRASDLGEVLALLASAGLPGVGVPEHLDGFLIACEDGRLVATAGLEDHGTVGILRSVAVVPGCRGRGVAATLVRAIIGRSHAKGHEALYLLTNAAESYFERFGFQRVERAQVRSAALASKQFTEKACEKSTVMVLEHKRSGRVSMNEHAIREAVRERYARAATAGTPCCAPAPITFADGRAVPEEIVDTSLGCGAPIEAAALKPGETVVDLGSGAGLDAFLAADRVGPSGRAIGVDMTPEMIAKARANASRLGAANVEFRLGEIEHLPLPDACADVLVSNCVINLLPDKRPAFSEAFRVLRPGGRLVVSDIVSAAPVPDEFKTPELWSACLAGALPEADYLGLIAGAGFTSVEVLSKRGWNAAGLFSATVRAVKPKGV
ncbi:MAG: arsenite methyltransferase [bacterium]|nr:arsenite methyltransferase [bacterium]